MAFPIKFSHVAAIALTAGVAVYMLGGDTMLSGQGPINPEDPARAVASSAGDDALFAVRATAFSISQRPNVLTVRGRTEPDASVTVSAETAGRVVAVAVEEGDQVAVGDLLCRLDEATRQANLIQARASLAQAETDLNAATDLAARGFAAQNQVPALQAAFNAAQAMVEQAELDLTRTDITAPIAGLVQLPLADVGTQLAAGAMCATLLDTDPLVVTGQVSENEIATLRVGMPADITLVTGEATTGRVGFIAATADPQTRTFQVDIDVPNRDGAMRGGVTAQADIGLPASAGHLIPLSTLKLSDAGDVGVSILDEEDRVIFQPVAVLGDEAGSVWVAGLPEEVRVIVVGQDYVEPGQKVAVTLVEEGILQTSQALLDATSPQALEEGVAQ